MKLYGVMMVRNEADIIEACVRHNLTLLDRLVVIDHGSLDGTAEILRRLAQEGLALAIVTDPSPEFRQGARITQVARAAIVRDGVDFTFALDADEFLKAPSRGALEETLRRVPPVTHAVLQSQTYVPDDLAADLAVFSPACALRRRKVERHTAYKVVVARHFGQRPRDAVIDGNHVVVDLDAPGAAVQHARIPPEALAIAHVPVRSRGQLERKIVVGYLAHLASRPDSAHVAYHWRDLYEDIRAGTPLDAARLTEIACNYGLERAQWQPPAQVELVADPFFAPIECQYRSEASLDTLRLLMRFCERLAGSP